MSAVNKHVLKQAIINKLDDPTFSGVQAPPEELSNYAMLNIERNCDLKAMIDNLSVFMGDEANSFCKWLFDYTGQNEGANAFGSEQNNERSYSRGGSLSREISPPAVRRVNQSWVPRDQRDAIRSRCRFSRSLSSDRTISLANEHSVRQIPSVVSTTRMAANNRRRNNNDFQDRRGATHIFLRAVDQADNVRNLERTNRVRRKYHPYYQPTYENPKFTGDLRDKINEARRMRQQKFGTERMDLTADSALENYPSTTTRRTTRLTHIEATVTDQHTTVDDEMQGTDETVVKNVPRPIKKKVRCKFWPRCVRGDDCIYVHPSEACKLFPNCQFGRTCLYIHPNCPNDGSCPKPECSYLHQKQTKPVINLPVANPFNNSQPTTQPGNAFTGFGSQFQSQTTKPAGTGQFFLVNKPSNQQAVCPIPRQQAPVIQRKPTRVCYFDATCARPGCPYLHPNRSKFTCKSAFSWVKPTSCKYINKNASVKKSEAAMSSNQQVKNGSESFDPKGDNGLDENMEEM